MKKINFLLLFLAFFLIAPVIESFAARQKSDEYEGARVVSVRYTGKIKAGKKLLRKKDAEEHIGDLRQKVTDGNYTGANLIRKARGVKYFNISDGVVFNANGGRFGFVKKKDGQYIIALDHPDGRKKDVVDEDNFHDFEIAINDDCRAPYVFFDQDGNEAAIVYLPRHVLIRQKFTKNGEVVLKIEDGKQYKKK